VIQSTRSQTTHETPEDFLSAMQGRRDPRRPNGSPRQAAILAGALRTALARYLAFNLAELGAGDGEFLLSVAGKLRGPWRSVEAILVDSNEILSEKTRNQFAGINWRVQSVKQDPLEWLRGLVPGRTDVLIASMFLHQFDDRRLRLLFEEIAAKSRVFVAIEPRKSGWALLGSHLRSANHGTGERAEASGGAPRRFFGRELSALWPDLENWQLNEGRAGLFNHLFVAQRKDRPSAASMPPVAAANGSGKPSSNGHSGNTGKTKDA